MWRLCLNLSSTFWIRLRAMRKVCQRGKDSRFMTKVVCCDRCQQECTDQYMELSGWWYLVEEHSKSRTGKLLSDELSGDLCPRCRDQLGLRTNLSPTRQERWRRWMAENPGRSGLEGGRRTACTYIEEVYCDRCEQPCSNRYARLESSQLTSNQEVLHSEICPACFSAIDRENRMTKSGSKIEVPGTA